jgi:hypothetical protein
MLYNEETFYRAFTRDVLAAKKEVIIYSPFVSKYRNLANEADIAFGRLVVYSDIFQFRLADGCLVYGCFALLKQTRQILSLAFSYTMEAELVARTIERIDFTDFLEALWHPYRQSLCGTFCWHF